MRNKPPIRSYACTALAIAALTFCLTSQADQFSITFGAPGQQTPSSTVVDNAEIFGIETFDNRPLGDHSFTTDFPTECKNCTQIMGTYSLGANIQAADVFGGAGGTGRFVTAFGTTSAPRGPNSYTLRLSTPPGVSRPGDNYFGLWISALDAGNFLTFEENGTPVGTFTPSDLIDALGVCRGLPGSGGSGTGNQRYCGNPNAPFSTSTAGSNSTSTSRGNRNEQYAFVNFVDETGTFNEVIVTQNSSLVGGGANYESDNQSVGFCLNPRACISGTPIHPVPEPGTWSLLLIGFAIAGVAWRRPKWPGVPA